MTTILIVDDSSQVRKELGRALTAAGFFVIEASDGLAALEKVAAVPEIACVLCDVNMPRMSGVEFIEALARRASRPPVLMLTSETSTELFVRAKAAGMAAWVRKPCNPAYVVAAACKITGHRAGLDEAPAPESSG